MPVICRVIGGLGNQLFSYAAARRLALINNMDLVIDDKSGFVNDNKYKRQYQLEHFNISCRKATRAERLEPFSRARRYIKRYLNLRLPFEGRNYIKQEKIDYDPRLLNIRPRKTVYLEGYWQSEDYFKDIEDTIREDLTIIPPTDAVNMAMAEQIKNKSAVAVHVRFFDAPGEKGINNTTRDYYARAIKVMQSKSGANAHYFIFSDRPNDAGALLSLPEECITCVSHNHGDENAYADLWLMTLCRHFIIANSTFSWWGAWLSSGSDKTIIAPGFEVREGVAWWGFNGLIPDGWIKC